MIPLFILYILATAWFSNLFTWKLTFKPFTDFKKKYLNYKVFKCSTCFSFWFSLTFQFFFTLLTSKISLSLFFVSLMLSLVISCITTLIETQTMLFSDED